MHSGSLTVITGTMFAGKTKELMRLCEREQIAARPYIIFKPVTDVRSPQGHIKAADGRLEHAEEINAENPRSILAQIKEKEALRGSPFSLVAVDEGNFFARDSGISEVVHQLANEGYRVVVAGLDLDFKGRPFG